MQSPLDLSLKALSDFLAATGELPLRPDDNSHLCPADSLRDQLLNELRKLVWCRTREALASLSTAMRRLTEDPDAVADQILELRIVEAKIRWRVETLSVYELTDDDLSMLRSASALASSLDHQANFAARV